MSVRWTEPITRLSQGGARLSIYAFEPNPKNYRLMQSDGRLRARNIELVPMAASNYDGDADFFIVAAADSFEARLRRGMSSLYRRPNDWDVRESVLRVKTTRLDTFLNHKASGERRIALWIDAEGKAYEVIEGMTGILKNIHLIHVEVETTCSIGANQRLYSDVRRLLQQLGFAELASDDRHGALQFNALFVRHDLPSGKGFELRAWRFWARLRHVVGRFVARSRPTH